MSEAPCYPETGTEGEIASPGAHLGCLSGSHCGQEPWLQSQPMAVVLPSPLLVAAEAPASTMSLLGPRICCGYGASDGGAVCGDLQPGCAGSLDPQGCCFPAPRSVTALE